MRARKSREVPADLARALQRFQQWRSGRQGKSRIPDSLWKEAVQLAHEHGVSRTASVLKLDYYALKKRLSAAEPVASAGPTFVELPLSPRAATSQCVIELNDGAGECMRVSLQGYPASDLAELGRTFWETQQCCKSLRGRIYGSDVVFGFRACIKYVRHVYWLVFVDENRKTNLRKRRDKPAWSRE